MLGRTEEALKKNKDCSLLREVSDGDPQKPAETTKMATVYMVQLCPSLLKIILLCTDNGNFIL